MPYHSVIDAKGGDDLAVFSRFRIVEEGSVLLPERDDPWPRPGIYSRIEAGTAAFDIYAFHFKAMGDQESERTRKAQAAALGDFLRSRYSSALTEARIVLAGDFNTANTGDLAGRNSTLSALCLADDADPGNDFTETNYRLYRDTPTFVNSSYSSVLDHILLSPAFGKELAGSAVSVLAGASSGASIPVSDHRMVVVELAYQE